MQPENYHKANFFEERGEESVRCVLCPHLCLIRPDEVGYCNVRMNIRGDLYTLNYGRVSSAHLDPIEKKPLYRFYPGSTIFSIGTLGCNLGCPWCQNWSISKPFESTANNDIPIVIASHTEQISPQQIVEFASGYETQRCIGVAFTYNEPFIWYEFVKETAMRVKEAGMRNVLVTNGYVMKEPLGEILPYIDAMNIDIKGFTESFYKNIDGHLRPVMQTAETAKKSCHVELTNLLIPGLNDNPSDIKRLVDWIASSLGPETPLHLSRYFPMYKQETSSTPLETMRIAEEIANDKLKYVYLGNV